MMKNITFLICFLLLTNLLHEAQGIKSRKLLTNSNNSKLTTSSEKHTKIQASASDAKVNGKISTSTTTTTSSKQEEHSEKRETFSVKSSPVVERQKKAAPKQKYPDVLDIAGMDYSPARRKSPIHN